MDDEYRSEPAYPFLNALHNHVVSKEEVARYRTDHERMQWLAKHMVSLEVTDNGRFRLTYCDSNSSQRRVFIADNLTEAIDKAREANK